MSDGEGPTAGVDHDLEDGQSWAAASIKGLDAAEYALPVGMRAAAARILQTMGTGKDPGERHLGFGWGSEQPLERWARAYAAGNPRSDLAVMYGLGVVATMVAAQGGVVLSVPVPGSSRGLDIPATSHFMVEAPSGWRKSTALNVVKEPLERALAAGLEWRRGQAVAGAKAALAALDAGSDGTGGGVGDKDAGKDLAGQVETVFLGGVCGLTHVKDPTVEALRNVAVGNGGCVAVLAGEADVFRNLTNYGNGSAGAGSLSFFLDLWGQDSVETVRVKGGVIRMRKVALNLAVLFQTDVFAEVTAGKSGTGADSFMSRGVFGRSWVVEAYNSGLGEASLYGDDAAMGGWGDGDLVLSDQDAAMVELEAGWRDLAVSTSGYRAAKGRLRAWEVGLETAGSKWKVDREVARAGFAVDGVGDPVRRVVGLDASGLLAYKRLHRMADAVKDAVDSAPPGVEAMWATLAARLVDHVLRDALAVCLAGGGDVVTGEAISDAAVRLLPWRVGMQATALAGRAGEIARGRIREEMRVNPKMVDRDATGVIRTALLRLAMAKPTMRAGGFPWSEIRRRAIKHAGWNGPGMDDELRRGLDELVADPDSGVTAVAGKPNVSGQVAMKYVIDKLAVDDAAK